MVFGNSDDRDDKNTLLGTGNFGEVRLGILDTIEPIAVKFLKDNCPNFADFENFICELKIIMSLQILGPHPNIVAFIGATTKKFQKSN
jgi:hypothetical protein